MDGVGMLIDEKIVGIWFVQTLETQDFMLSLRELESEKLYEFVYRFRYYDTITDGNPFNLQDRKSWYEGRVAASRQKSIEKMQFVVNMLTLTAGVTQYALFNDKGFEDFAKRLKEQPFVHGKWVTKG